MNRAYLTWKMLVFGLALVVASPSAMAQTMKAFYIGHSLSDQISDMVKSLCDDAGTQFDWAYQSIPGSPLRWQWERMAANDYPSNPPHYYGFYDSVGGLAAGDFDALVMVESVPRHLEGYGGIDETYGFAGLFLDYAESHNPNIQVFLYEPWHCILSGTPTGCDYDVDSAPWRQRLTDDLPMWESVVNHLNTHHNPVHPVRMIPGGQGLARLYDAIQSGTVPGLNSINDIFSDNIHLTDVGKYYVACIHYGVLQGVSPVGLTNQLKVWWGGDFSPPTPELAVVLQQLAWETVLAHAPASNQPPVIQVVGETAVMVGGTVTIIVEGEDADEDALTYAATGDQP